MDGETKGTQSFEKWQRKGGLQMEKSNTVTMTHHREEWRESRLACSGAGVEEEKVIGSRWQTEMKVDIDEVTDRCNLLLVQLLPKPEAAQLLEAAGRNVRP